MNGNMRCRVGRWGMALCAAATLSVPTLAQAQNMTADIGGGFVPGNSTSGNTMSGNTMSGNMTDTEGTLVNETGFIN